MWLAFALSRQWPPYAKWRGTAFQALAIAADLARLLAASAAAPGWRDREGSLAEACEVLLERATRPRAPGPRICGHPILGPAFPHRR